MERLKTYVTRFKQKFRAFKSQLKQAIKYLKEIQTDDNYNNLRAKFAKVFLVFQFFVNVFMIFQDCNFTRLRNFSKEKNAEECEEKPSNLVKWFYFVFIIMCFIQVLTLFLCSFFRRITWSCMPIVLITNLLY